MYPATVKVNWLRNYEHIQFLSFTVYLINENKDLSYTLSSVNDLIVRLIIKSKCEVILKSNHHKIFLGNSIL